MIWNGPDSTIGFFSGSRSSSNWVLKGRVSVDVDISITFCRTTLQVGLLLKPKSFVQVRALGASSNSAGNSSSSFVVVLGMSVESPLTSK